MPGDVVRVVMEILREWIDRDGRGMTAWATAWVTARGYCRGDRPEVGKRNRPLRSADGGGV